VQCACAILSSVTLPSLESFSTLSHKRHDFRKTVIEHKMCVLIFSTRFVGNISHSMNNRARYGQKCIFVFMQSTQHSCRILMKLEFCPQVLENYSNIKFNKIPSNGSRVVQYRWTDRRTDITKLIVAFAILRARLKTL
jgi:hypothetical protein